LVFKEDDEKWLKMLYKKTKNTGFRSYFSDKLNKAIQSVEFVKAHEKALQALEKKKSEHQERQDELAHNGGIALAA